MRRRRQQALVVVFLALLGACATISPASRIKARLIDLGMPRSTAACLADTLEEELDRSDLNDVARFLDALQDIGPGGRLIDRLRRIDNPRAAATVGVAAISCAVSG